LSDEIETPRLRLRYMSEDFVMATEPENRPAIALAKKLGFEKAAEHVDPEDGLEYVYVLRGKALERLLHSNA
jgi:RimJ/RimL family protein N-acetyltransferase